MIGRILGVAGASVLFVALFYTSRYWPFRWWGRDGLFGVEALRPQGNLMPRALRGTDFAVFDLVLWAVAGFLILTAVQAIVDRLRR